MCAVELDLLSLLVAGLPRTLRSANVEEYFIESDFQTLQNHQEGSSALYNKVKHALKCLGPCSCISLYYQFSIRHRDD